MRRRVDRTGGETGEERVNETGPEDNALLGHHEKEGCGHVNVRERGHCGNLERVLERVLEETERNSKNLVDFCVPLKKFKKRAMKKRSRIATSSTTGSSTATTIPPELDAIEAPIFLPLRPITNNNAWETHGWDLADEVRRDLGLIQFLDDRRWHRTEFAHREYNAMMMRLYERSIARGHEEHEEWVRRTQLFREVTRGASA